MRDGSIGSFFDVYQPSQSKYYMRDGSIGSFFGAYQPSQSKYYMRDGSNVLLDGIG